jgi:hypothetical protein
MENHSGAEIMKDLSIIITTRLMNLNRDYFSLYNKTRTK